MGKGSSGTSQTVVQQSSPPPQFLAAYQQAVDKASAASQAPYAPYGGSMVAPFSDLQTAAFTNAAAPSQAFYATVPAAESAYGIAGNAYGAAGNAYGAAGNAYAASTAPLWANTMQYTPENLQQFISPYINDVVNSTAQQFANTNAIQNAGVVGNAAAQGAWGGDRSAVAQALLAGQQQQAEAPVLAGLLNTGFTQAQQQFNAQQAAQLGANEAQGWLASQAGAGLAGLGTGYGGLGAGLTNLGNAQANLGVLGANVGNTQEQLLSSLGAQQQQELQAGLNVPYQQYVAGQAYPFQTAQFFSNIATGAGSGAGGTASTTSPGPSTMSQLAGLGIGGIGLLGQTGAFGSSGWLTGAGGLLGGSLGAAGTGLMVPGTTTALTGGFAIAPFALGAARGGKIDPTKESLPKSPSVAARPMEIGLRFIPHKLHMGDGGIVGYSPNEIQHFDTGGAPISAISIPDESISWVPQSQDGGIRGGGPPKPPQPMPQQQQDIGKLLGSLGDALKQSGLFSKDSSLARGGGLRGYDDGGAVRLVGMGADLWPEAYAGEPEDATTSAGIPETKDIGGWDWGTSRVPNTLDTGDPNVVKHKSFTLQNPHATLYMPWNQKRGDQELARGGGLRGYAEGGDTKNFIPPDTSPDYFSISDTPGSQANHPTADQIIKYGPNYTVEDAYRDAGQSLQARAGNPTIAPIDLSVSAPRHLSISPGPLTEEQANRVLPFIKQDESGNRNIMQHAYSGAPGEINPSTGTHTAPSTAQGYEQYTNSTWRTSAPEAGVDLSKYPTAMSAPEEVQDMVAKHDLMTKGAGAWAPYNPTLAAHIGWTGPSARGIAGSPTEVQMAQATPTTMSDASPDLIPQGIRGSTPSAEPSTQTASALKGMGVDPWLALMIAGFGMAAGNSPHALQNIGAGALEGAKALQLMRVQGPEMALRSAQAEKAAAEATMEKAKVNLFMGAGVTDPYAGNANPSVGQVSGALDNVVKNAAKQPTTPTQPPEAPVGLPAAAPSGTVSGAPTAGATVAPATPQSTLQVSPEVQQLHQQYQAQIAAIDQQIAQVQRNLAIYQTPQMQRMALIDGTVAGSRNVLLNQLSALQERRLGYVTADPYSHLVQTAGETSVKAGAEPQEYQVPGPGNTLVTRVAPRQQVMAGTAPGMQPSAAPQGGQITEGGKYDPSPESIIPTAPPPGAVKIERTNAQTDKLAADAKELNEYRDAAEKTPVTVQRVKQLSDILHRLQTGAGTEIATDLTNWARSAGLESLIPERFNPTDAQEVNKLATSLVFEQLKAIGGRPMVSEIQGLQKSNPNLTMTNEANLAILGNIQAEAQLAQDRYSNASKVFSRYGQLGDFDRRYLENSPAGKIYASTHAILNQNTPPMPGAVRGPDGNWYGMIGGKPHLLQPGSP